MRKEEAELETSLAQEGVEYFQEPYAETDVGAYLGQSDESMRSGEQHGGRACIGSLKRRAGLYLANKEQEAKETGRGNQSHVSIHLVLSWYHMRGMQFESTQALTVSFPTPFPEILYPLPLSLLSSRLIFWHQPSVFFSQTAHCQPQPAQVLRTPRP
jgi:hypothetical protein